MVAVRATAQSLPTIPRADVGARILAGEHLLIYHGLVLRVPQSWLAAHPGGETAILHYVGRDCTDEVDAFHPDDVCEAIRKYAVGALDASALPWHPYVPPVMTGWVRKQGPDGAWSWFKATTSYPRDLANRRVRSMSDAGASGVHGMLRSYSMGAQVARGGAGRTRLLSG